MASRRRLLPLGLAAAFAVAGGTAWAMTEGGDSDPVGPAPTTGILAQGTAPSGESYTISGIDPGEVGADPTNVVCIEIKTDSSRTQGCELIPDQLGATPGQPVSPSMSLLGADRFLLAVAPPGVKTMEVGIVGEAKTTSSRSLDVGAAGKLLVVMVGGPPVTSRDPASSRDYNVRLLDADGKTVQEATKSDPG